MANIPVEHKSGTPAWLWPLLILALLALLFFLFAPGCGEEDVAVLPVDEDTVGVVDAYQPEPTGELLLDGPVDVDGIDALFTRLNSGNILGALVQLDNVTATSVTGDSTFYVSSSDASRSLLVVLEGLGESQSNMGSADGVYSIQEGEEMDIRGRITTMPPAFRDRYTMRDNASMDYYLRARVLDVQGGSPSQR